MWTWNDGFVILYEESFFSVSCSETKKNGQNANFWGNN